LGAVLILISLPAAFAIADALAFYVRNRSTGFIASSGEKREYVLYVPESYDRTRPTPLVISMHGAAGWGAQQRDLSQWNRVAEREGIIVVYPSGAEAVGPRVWEVFPGEDLMRDVRFISELVDALEAEYNIDPTRVYANGLSNGGGMAFVLSCTLSDRIAAVGMVAAAQTLPWSWCKDHRPVPMIAFHGTADTIVPYDGGTAWVSPRPFPDVATWTANWARRNRCGSNPLESAAAVDVTRLEYTDCADDASVVLYTVEGGGHTWPGGQPLPEWFAGPTSHEIDAASQMWEFFQSHRLRE